MKILLVEDDTMIASGLMYALEQEGYEPFHCMTASDAVHRIKTELYDLAILDMQLPDGTGFDVSRELKENSTPIIFLIVVDDESKIVSAFENGAADYVTKPFRLRELLARVKRTLQAAKGENPTGFLKIGNAEIDPIAGKVYVGSSPVELTALEYRLLLIFANNKGNLLTRTQILDSIWDQGSNFVEDNTLTVYIKRLREKMGSAVTIETVRGLGYRAD